MLIFLIILFLVLSALFSGTEIAFISASKLRVELSKKRDTLNSRIMGGFYEKPNKFISTLLVGNNIALASFTLLFEIFLDGSMPIAEGGFKLLIYTLISTVIVLIFGEFLPKTIFKHLADQAVYALAIPLRVIQGVLFLPSFMMSHCSNIILKYVLRTPIENVEYQITKMDLGHFIKNSSKESDDEINTDIFEKALHLEEQRVKSCMVPRTEIEAVDISNTIDDLLERLQTTNLSRILVTSDGDINDILGYVHHQQLLKHPKNIKSILLDIPFVPEAMRIRDLMNRFIKENISIACVVDEYGGTAGIVTMEDIVEEIFGEIEDEHDQEEHIETQISEHEFIFSGRLEINYLNEKYNLNFPEGEYTTLSGYLVMTSETIPDKDSKIELDGYKFIIELVGDTKIDSIRVIKPKNQNEELDR
jgi:CBS domain containing-hemolysin-like protein